MEQKKPLSGFTLLELLIAVIIIGILVTLAIPQFAKSTEQSKCSEAMGILKNMRTAQVDYYADNLTYTSSVSDLEAYTGADYYSDGSNPDWTFSTTGGTDTFTLTASRTSGHWSGKTITLNQDGTWSDPASGYPWDNPTNY